MLTPWVPTSILFPSDCCRLSCTVKKFASLGKGVSIRMSSPREFPEFYRFFLHLISAVSQTAQMKSICQLWTFAEIILFSFLFSLSSAAKRGIYELYLSWTAAEQGSYSFASPLEAQAQKLYCEMEKQKYCPAVVGTPKAGELQGENVQF